MKIAFIGLGNMGGGMAANLVKAGHQVNAFDLSAEALERAKDNGCTPFTNVREAVADAEAVVSMLPNGKIVDTVYEGDFHTTPNSERRPYPPIKIIGGAKSVIRTNCAR